jgi:hypothetical protein
MHLFKYLDYTVGGVSCGDTKFVFGIRIIFLTCCHVDVSK